LALATIYKKTLFMVLQYIRNMYTQRTIDDKELEYLDRICVRFVKETKDMFSIETIEEAIDILLRELLWLKTHPELFKEKAADGGSKKL